MSAEFCDQVLSQIYLAWLEEAVAVGAVKVPGGAGRFYERRSLIGFASWLTPGRGKIDPLKEGQASDIEVFAGRSSNAIECANNGLDLNEVLMAQAREKLMRKKLGLPEFTPLKLAGSAGGDDGGGADGGSGSDRQDGDGDGVPNEEQQRRKAQPEGANQ